MKEDIASLNNKLKGLKGENKPGGGDGASVPPSGLLELPTCDAPDTRPGRDPGRNHAAHGVVVIVDNITVKGSGEGKRPRETIGLYRTYESVFAPHNIPFG